jgi:predicted CopG family antitoxin
MAVKTITIDMEAYDLLARHKAAGQSFSQVIKAHFGRQPTAAGFREIIRAVRVSPDALDAMDAQVRRRTSEPARAARRRFTSIARC